MFACKPKYANRYQTYIILYWSQSSKVVDIDNTRRKTLNSLNVDKTKALYYIYWNPVGIT